MSDREARRFDQLSDGHLADKAAYGDQGAFVALAERFHDPVWTVAALASSDAGTATRATARAFTRTLAGVAAGIGDPDACVERALVAAAFELAVTARVDEADLVAALPPALRALDPGTRVAVWLTGQGWAAADAVAVVTAADEPAPDLAAVAPAARDAAGALALDTPAGLAAATTDAWHEWQGIGLTIPDRHPLTAVLSRLDAPLGRMGDALGRTARTARTTRRRRARAAAAATPPPPVLLPVGADESTAEEADATSTAAADDAKPFGARIAAAAVAASSTKTTTVASTTSTTDRAPTAPEPAGPTPPPGLLDGPVEHDLDQLDRRGRPRPGHLVTAGSTPTRTRVLAALAAGILTASAMGSLLTGTPADGPTSGSEQVAAAEAPPDETQSSGDLLEEELVPVVDVDDTTTSTGATTGPGPTAGAPTARPTTGGGGDTTGGSGADDGAPAPGRTPSTGSGGSGGGGAPVSPPGSEGSSGGGGGTGGGGSAPTQPPATTPPAPPTTSPPPPTTTPPPPTTTPPPATDPGLVCGLLPVLCPGGGLVP